MIKTLSFLQTAVYCAKKLTKEGITCVFVHWLIPDGDLHNIRFAENVDNSAAGTSRYVGM